MATLQTNELHYGDNLEVMRDKIPDEIADLIYLDPPFNSARSYNLLFKQVKGDASPAQIHAFEDTSHRRGSAHLGLQSTPSQRVEARCGDPRHDFMAPPCPPRQPPAFRDQGDNDR